MTEFLDISSGGARRARGLFPTPLVGVAALLAVLIVLTPVLIATGPPAPGSLLAHADLWVDRVAGGSVTNLYVHGVGDAVRYATIALGIATNFAWSGGYPSGPLRWSTWQNGTSVLEVSLAVPNGSFAVNVTATYTVGSQTAFYVGLIAFNVTGISTPGETLSIAVSPRTPGVVAPTSVAVGALPANLGLEESGGPLP